MRDELTIDIWKAYRKKYETLKGLRKILFEATANIKIKRFRNEIIKDYIKCDKCGGYFKKNIRMLKNGSRCCLSCDKVMLRKESKKVKESKTIRISLSTITYIARRGRLSLQIPDIYICENEEDKKKHEEELFYFPKEYFCFLNSNNIPSPNESNSFLFLTRKGYEFFKEDLKKAFEEALSNGRDRTGGRGWKAFEENAEKHFKEIEIKIRKKISSLKNQKKFFEDFKV